jgi:hypothetical protein
MRRAASVSLAVLLGAACAAPAIDSALDTDGTKLPDRSPIATDDAGTIGPADSAPLTPANPKVSLTVALTGSGTGTVTSSPTGLTCAGSTCTGAFDPGTAVALTAVPAAGAVFVAWSGPCTGAACAPTLSADLAVGAQLEQLAGAWTGTYTNTRVAGCTFNNAGDLTAAVTATGATFASAATMTGLELRGGRGCPVLGKTTGSAPSVALTVAANNLTGTWTFAVQSGGTLAFPFTAKVVGKTMTGSWTCATCTGGFTLTRP